MAGFVWENSKGTDYKALAIEGSCFFTTSCFWLGSLSDEDELYAILSILIND